MKLPDDLTTALYAFVQHTEDIRAVLADSHADQQELITLVANLTATARAHIPTVLSKTGKAPVVHFLSTIFVPAGYAFVSKNDIMLWGGPIHDLATAGAVADWPSGSSVHLAPKDWQYMVSLGQGVNAMDKRR